MDNPVGSMENGAQNEASSQQAFEGPEWMSGLPDDLRGSKSLSKFKDVENLARGYVNAERLIGRDQIPMPKTDDEFKAAYAKLGCPEDVSGYKVPFENPFANTPMQGMLEEDLKAFLPWAKEVGLNNKQATALFNNYVGRLVEIAGQQNANIASELARADEALSREFGEQKEVKLSYANRALSALGDKSLIDAIAESGLGRNPAFIRMMVRVGEMHAEELGIDKTGSSNLMSPSDLSAAISELQAHPAYLDASHPEHKAIVERVGQLFARANAK
mgnify:CR=1 FL=1